METHGYNFLHTNLVFGTELQFNYISGVRGLNNI